MGALAAPYFRRRKPITDKVIDLKLAYRGFTLSARLRYANQPPPIVRDLTPNRSIVRPNSSAPTTKTESRDCTGIHLVNN